MFKLWLSDTVLYTCTCKIIQKKFEASRNRVTDYRDTSFALGAHSALYILKHFHTSLTTKFLSNVFTVSLPQSWRLVRNKARTGYRWVIGKLATRMAALWRNSAAPVERACVSMQTTVSKWRALTRYQRTRPKALRVRVRNTWTYFILVYNKYNYFDISLKLETARI